MKKFLIKLTTLLFAASIISGCGDNGGNTPKSELDEDYYVDTTYDSNDDLISGGSYGGFFDEVNMNRYLTKNRTFDFRFYSSYTKDSSFTVHLSYPIGEILNQTKTGFDLKVTKLGDSVMTIYNAQDVLVYRKLVRVRPAYTVEEATKALYEVDRFKSKREWEPYLGSWNLAFTSEDPLTGTLSGGDDMESNVRFKFTCQYSLYSSEFDAYLFLAEQFETNSEYTTVYGFYVTRAMDELMIYETFGIDPETGEHSTGLISFLYPSN